MTEQPSKDTENIAATLDRVLPKPVVLSVENPAAGQGSVTHVAVPRGFELKQIDNEHLLSKPRRAIAVASFTDAASFIAYVQRHAIGGTTTWCSFDPQTFALSFTAVIDEHDKGVPGWRKHRAEFKPSMSAEWKLWKAADGKQFSQVDFAEWIEAHADDIAAANGLPTSLQMLTMATEFQANEERVLKSSVKLQSGGVRLTYIADPDAGTTESMQMFERFAIGIPVFHDGSAWSITARLKYRLKGGSVSFFFELVRPDRVHQGAAKELITQIREAIGVPVLMGSCS
jgi:uncharacterized protein YfdQ (DUF2303 family)